MEMVDLLLMNDIEEYNEIQKKIDELTEKKNELNEKIKVAMIDQKVNKVETTNGVTASLVAKTSSKYTDEVALIKYLKENDGLKYIKETVNTKLLNEDLKKSPSLLTENLKPTSSVSYSLTVK